MIKHCEREKHYLEIRVNMAVIGKKNVQVQIVFGLVGE